jgi:hypothetical protein
LAVPHHKLLISAFLIFKTTNNTYKYEYIAINVAAINKKHLAIMLCAHYIDIRTASFECRFILRCKIYDTQAPQHKAGTG